MLTTNDNRLGSTIGGYRLLSVLGTGSTSIVYLGQLLDDPRALVAVKVLNIPAAGPSPDLATFRARFLREARAASKLRNEFILPVLSYGDTAELSYMVMPVIVGGTLAFRLAAEKQPLPLDEIATYLAQLGEALGHAHQQGVVHRDVKPSNILLDEHRHVYLTDFGIARIFDTGDNAMTREGPLTLTHTGQVLGTPYYMAPEQIKGEPVGPATDIYALGVVVYQLVTGQVPFHGDTPLAVALQHLQETPSPPRLLRDALPAPIEDVILRALAKDPANRFASASEMAQAFQNGLAIMQSTQPLQPSQSLQQAWPFSTGYRLPSLEPAATAAARVAPHEPPTPDELIGTTVGAYHIDRALDALGGDEVYSARRDGKPYRVHFWRAPRDLPPEEQASYLEHVREGVRALAALEAEHILALVDYGDFRGLPYLVTSDVPGPSLTDLLDRSGPLPLATSSAYLDQIAGALEAAHERGILHLNLTTDCIYIWGQGGQERAVVDFAASRVVRSSAGASRQPAYYTIGDAWSPEQILGKPEGAYTDVYALGAVLFQMLTTRPVFTGTTRDAIAQQHLHLPVPALRESRADLPLGIDYVVARALAKAPAQRFAHPSELAAAYRRLIEQTRAAPAFVMARPLAERGSATIPLEPGSTTATSRNPAAGRPSSGPLVTAADFALVHDGTPPAQAPHAPLGGALGELEPTSPGRVPSGPIPPPRQGGFLRSRLFAEIASILVILGLVGGTLIWFTRYRPAASTPKSTPVVTAPPVTATVRYFDSRNSPGALDGLIIDTTNLAAPPAGHTYMAWLIDDATEHHVSLGALVQGDKGFTLTYSPSGSGPGPNLIAAGNRVEITLEQGAVTAPIGKIVLSGVSPPQTLVHIKHLLVAFPTTPGQRGFLVGLQQQATILDQQAHVLQGYVQRTGFPRSIHCTAQNIVDILEGSRGQNYSPLGPECGGGGIVEVDDGYGILGTDGYLAGVSDHASLAANTPDATAHIRLHAQHLEIAATNITGWLTTVDQDAVSVLGGNLDPNKVQEIVTLASRALHGTDIDGDESIDPVIGEAGVATAYSHGLLLASIDLSASS